MNSLCRACGKNKLFEFLHLGDMPSAGGFLKNLKNIDCEELYPLPIHVCKNCCLIQVIKPIDAESLFKDYSFASSTVTPLINHFEKFSDWLIERFNPEKLLEFGCNDGILLQPLEKKGVTAIGIDISHNITSLAREKGLKVETGFFDIENAEKIVKKYGLFDIISGSNSFAHNEKPSTILNAAKLCLKDDGVLVLEFMYAGDLIEKLQWDTLYHEHLTFYSLFTIKLLLENNGFFVFDAEKITMHGGSIRLSASMNKRPTTESFNNLISEEFDKKINDFNTWINFGNNIKNKIDIVNKTLYEIGRNKKIWAYGAAGKATMWLNACNLNYVEAIIDESPLRAGKFMPGTHTPILFPSELKKNPPDYIFITAWNYADIIKKKESWYKGIWITPLPELKFF